MRSDLGWRRDYFARRLFPASVIWINRGGLKFHAAGESASPDHKRLRSRVYGDGKLSAGCPSTLLTRERVSWIYFNRQGRRAYLEFPIPKFRNWIYSSDRKTCRFVGRYRRDDLECPHIRSTVSLLIINIDIIIIVVVVDDRAPRFSTPDRFLFASPRDKVGGTVVDQAREGRGT